MTEWPVLTRYDQEEGADQYGPHHTYIGTMERGEKKIIEEAAKKMVDALGLVLQ